MLVKSCYVQVKEYKAKQFAEIQPGIPNKPWFIKVLEDERKWHFYATKNAS